MYALNGAMDECVSEAGHPEWDWSSLAEPVTEEDPLGASDWFGEIDRTYWSDREMAYRSFMLAQAEANSDEPRPAS